MENKNENNENFEQFLEPLFKKTIDENGKETVELTKCGYFIITLCAFSVLTYLFKKIIKK
jgi:hypothetical protein|nr:MAG TPA: hypothetical protein [Inoviridae sp.]